jgi:hypothetical protein
VTIIGADRYGVFSDHRHSYPLVVFRQGNR